MKDCTVCGESKPIEGFQVRRASRDGRTAACKDCLSGRDQRRAMAPHRVAAREAYQKTERGRDRRTAAQRAWIERNPEKRAAHIAVGNAVRDGKLIKPKLCETCRRRRKLHAHHHDYTKPLDVTWLCTSCHREHHERETS